MSWSRGKSDMAVWCGWCREVVRRVREFGVEKEGLRQRRKLDGRDGAEIGVAERCVFGGFLLGWLGGIFNGSMY